MNKVNNKQPYPVVTPGEWVLTLILLSIPYINIVLLIVWAVSGSTNPNKKNFAKAYLIILGVVMILSILFFLGTVVFGVGMVGLGAGMTY